MSDSSNTDDNSTNLVDMDLDSFSQEFYGNKAPVAAEEHEENEEVNENEDDALATEADEDNSEETQEEHEEEETPKPAKKSAQERINEVVAKQRAAERERDALAARIRELEAAATKKPEAVQPEDPKPLREQLADMPDAPSPDALDADGKPKYKLGEFDPQYIRDLTKFTIEQETKAAKAEQAAEDQRKMVEAAQEELRSSWLQKVEETEKELPDLREKLGEMEAAFTGIDPNYGEFLAATIMSCDYGPEIMYYLSQNIGEAQRIVASGPAAATLAIGRLDAKFVKAAAPQEEKRNKKPSAAPVPPTTPTRGAGGRFSVAPDTSDLSAFEREFYNKK